MKRIREIAAAAVMAAAVWGMVALAGCATFEGNAGKTLASTAVTVDGAMQGWAMWVAEGQANPQHEAQVKAAYRKYQASMRVARAAYATLAATGERPAWEQASLVLASNRVAFIELTRTLMTR